MKVLICKRRPGKVAMLHQLCESIFGDKTVCIFHTEMLAMYRVFQKVQKISKHSEITISQICDIRKSIRRGRCSVSDLLVAIFIFDQLWTEYRPYFKYMINQLHTDGLMKMSSILNDHSFANKSNMMAIVNKTLFHRLKIIIKMRATLCKNNKHKN